MAKAEATVTIAFDSFDWPKWRWAKAQEIVCKALGTSAPRSYQAIKNAASAFGWIQATAWRDSARQSAELLIRCTACGKTGTASEITDAACSQMTQEQLNAWAFASIRTWPCRCSAPVVRRVDDGPIEWTEDADESAIGSVVTLIDGLTEAECLERFRRRQHHADLMSAPTASILLTPRQLETARAAWSAQLRAKVNEAREKERCRVVVDTQEEE